MTVGFGQEKTEAMIETTQRGDTVGCMAFVKQMALETGLSEGTINNVFSNMSDALAPFFQLGHGVYIGRSGKEGLGILYPKVVRRKVKVLKVDKDGNVMHDSQGKEVYETKVQLGVGVGFRASTALKAVLDGISLKDVTVVDADEDEEDPSTGSGQVPGGGQGGTTPPSLD